MDNHLIVLCCVFYGIVLTAAGPLAGHDNNRYVRFNAYQQDCCLCDDFDDNRHNHCTEKKCFKDYISSTRRLISQCEYCQFTQKYSGGHWKTKVQCSVKQLCEHDYARTLATPGCFGNGSPEADTICNYCCRRPDVTAATEYCINDTLNGYTKFEHFSDVSAVPALQTSTASASTTMSSTLSTTALHTTVASSQTSHSQHTCVVCDSFDGRNCDSNVQPCNEGKCQNRVTFDKAGNVVRVSKSCALNVECYFNMQTNDIVRCSPYTNNRTSANGIVCSYCCDSNMADAPCNIDLFTDTSSTTQSTVTTKTTSSTDISTLSTLPVTSSTTQVTSSTGATTSTDLPVTSSKTSSSAPASGTSSTVQPTDSSRTSTKGILIPTLPSTTVSTTSTQGTTTPVSACSVCDSQDGTNCNDDTTPCDGGQCQNRLVFDKAGNLIHLTKSCALEIECKLGIQANDIVRCNPFMVNRSSPSGIVCTYCCDSKPSPTPCNSVLIPRIPHARSRSVGTHVVPANNVERHARDTSSYQMECCQCDDFDDHRKKHCSEKKCFTDYISSERQMIVQCEYCQFTQKYSGGHWKTKVQCSVKQLCEHDYARTMATPGCFGNRSPEPDTICNYCCRRPDVTAATEYCINDTLHGYTKFEHFTGVPTATQLPDPTTSTIPTTPTTTTPSTTPTTTPTTMKTTTTKSTTVSTTTASTVSTTISRPLTSSHSQKVCSECNSFNSPNCNDRRKVCTGGRCQNRITFSKEGNIIHVEKSCAVDIECTSGIALNSITLCDPYAASRISQTGIVCTYCCDPNLSNSGDTPCNTELFTNNLPHTSTTHAPSIASTSLSMTTQTDSTSTLSTPVMTSLSTPGLRSPSSDSTPTFSKTTVTTKSTSNPSSASSDSKPSLFTSAVTSSITSERSSPNSDSTPALSTSVDTSLTTSEQSSPSSDLTPALSTSVDTSLSTQRSSFLTSDSTQTSAIPSSSTPTPSFPLTNMTTSGIGTTASNSRTSAGINGSTTSGLIPITTSSTSSKSSGTSSTQSKATQTSVNGSTIPGLSSSAPISKVTGSILTLPVLIGGNQSSSTSSSKSSSSLSSRQTLVPLGNFTSILVNSSSVSTSAASPLSSSTKSPVTSSKQIVTPSWHTKSGATDCMVCMDTLETCDTVYAAKTCEEPNNYCINFMKNADGGGVTVNRTCGDINRCYREWFQGSSDNDKCQQYKDGDIITVAFECTYCCTKDLCNQKISPDRDTLYDDV